MLENVLPSHIYNAINKIPYSSLFELKIRKDSPVVANINGDNYYLCNNFLSKTPNNSLIINNNDIKLILSKICEDSLYTYNDEITKGYITIDGGIRVGIAGDGVIDNGKIRTIKNICSLNFRFPHTIKNCSVPIFPFIYENNKLKNTLIVSPPSCGKTTMLKDIIYQLSNSNTLLNILVIDERNELTKLFDGKDIVNIPNLDVYSSVPKKIAFENGIRSLNPDLIVTDELNFDTDFNEIMYSATCGINIISSIHASSIQDLKNKPNFLQILDNKIFDRFVVLSNDNGVGTISGVYNSNLKLIGI